VDNREMRVRFVVGEREWELDAFDLDLDQAIALQKLTGRTWGDLCVSVDVADAEALKAMFWLARINAGEQVAYDDPSMSPKWRDFTFQILTKAEPPAK
jgi:hypothetical protein